MSEIFETAMLVCFGLSWPINLVKNIKAQTAKSTSLKFLLLIIFGYIFGIAAKLVNHHYNYVLAVYFLNLAVVMANLIVYFINVKKDKKAD
jgi:membrane protein DedA with SNARE-associated domain